jgi:iron complex transport system substrate-binding protein
MLKQTLLLFISLLILSACDRNQEKNSTIKTGCPQQIASLSLASDEILLDIIDDQRIIGITYLADNKKLSNVYDKTSKVPNKLRPNLEQILSLNPDIVIVADYIDFSFIHQIEKSGINTHFLRDLNSVDSIRANLNSLGDAVCERGKTDALITDMDKRIEVLTSRKLTNKPKILYLFPSFFTAGNNTTIDDLITTAGGINLGRSAGIEGNKKISREYILSANPDIILIGSYSPDEENFIATLKSDKVLSELKSIKNGNVYSIETSHLTTVSHHIVKGMEELAAIIDNYNINLDANKTKTPN